MSKKLYSVTDAYYVGRDGEPLIMDGVPEYGRDYFGEYTGKYPSEAASKAFTGLQKHIKNFPSWFPGYREDDPFPIIYVIQEPTLPSEHTAGDMKADTKHTYYGKRIPAHQGTRKIVSPDGRIRVYKWDNKITKIDDILNNDVSSEFDDLVMETVEKINTKKRERSDDKKSQSYKRHKAK